MSEPKRLSTSVLTMARFLVVYGAILCWLAFFVFRNDPDYSFIRTRFVLPLGIAFVVGSAFFIRCKHLWYLGGEFVWGSSTRGQRFTTEEVEAISSYRFVPGTRTLRVSTTRFNLYTVVDASQAQRVMEILDANSSTDSATANKASRAKP